MFGHLRDVMWRIPVRQLTRNHQQQHRRVRAGLQDTAARKLWNYRQTSTSAAAAEPAAELSNSELADVEWEFQSRRLSSNSTSVSSFGTAPILASHRIISLEASVFTTLDTALHSAVHLPLLANQSWWMQWLSDSGSDVLDQYVSGHRSAGQLAPRTLPRVGIQSFASAAALEQDQDEEDDEKQHKEQVLETKKVKVKLDHKKDKERYSKLRERQMKIESQAWEAAAAEYRELMLEMCKKNLAPNLPFVQSLVLGWFEPLKNAIEAEQKAVENLEFRKHRAGYGPFICQLPADMLAVITMHKIMGMMMSDLSAGGCVKVVSAAAQIGEAVEQEVGIYKLIRTVKKKKGKNDPKKGVDPKEQAAAAKDAKFKDQVKKLLKQRKLRVATSLVRHASGDEPWGSEIRVKVGSRLIEIMIEVATLQPPASQTEDDMGEMRPAFKHWMKTFPAQSSARKFGVIECDPLVVQELDKSVRHMVMPYMPMLVRPRKWTAYGSGGYLVLPATVMRIHGAKQQREAIQKATKTSMHNVFHALDTLGSVGWKINTRVLDVIEQIWEDGGRLAQMVDADNVSIPSRPCTEDEAEIRSWRREAGRAKRINSERHSLRCDTELKLMVARKLRDEEAFYYPHNLDFRGRAYPLHPHLNHLGSDMCRGVLEFAQGHTLGPTGLHWLKIHLANVFAGGVDKLSFEGRIAFAEERVDEIFDSAENPLGGRQWWLEAEDPFQCLATCMAIRDAILSGNPEKFVCHLPVHQDGSCNGLQHYAALGRDQIGAEAVNLIAGDRPADVYSGIATRVRAVIEKDAADDPRTNPNVEKAKLMLGQVDRKLVKQTVMTSVYGVTFIGARNQILSRLKERGLPDEAEMYRASCYVAKVTIDALGQMFKEARCIMSWLGDCAKIIALEGEPVHWTTPFGLPVVQPYRKPGRKMVKTSLQVLALRDNCNQPVAVSRQRSAFPPNFVHSLDGSHMMMTAIACKRAGINFAGVHDSFWTHAGTVDKMNDLLRLKFVQLYSQPILENLLADFKQQFPHLEFPEVPKRGDLDLNDVLKAPYFFN